MTDKEGITIREYLEKLLAGRDQLFQAQLEALTRHLVTKIDTLERSLQDTFRAMDKAIDKAEAAQREYNIRSNEFRGQLEDQAKTLMPRTETNVLMRTIEDKLMATVANQEDRFSRVSEDIRSLRESRSGHSGQEMGKEQLWTNIAAVSALLLSLGTFIALIMKTW